MSILISIRHPAGRTWARRLEGMGRSFLEQLRLEDAELSLSLVSDVAIRRLNRTWRGKDRPTDVLSFPAGEQPRTAAGPRPLGDVVISFDTARRQAAAHDRSVEEELALYLAHGLLHLLGYDHHRPQEAAAMALMEDVLLGTAGMVRSAGLGNARPARPRSGQARHRASGPRRRVANRSRLA